MITHPKKMLDVQHGRLKNRKVEELLDGEKLGWTEERGTD